MWRPHIVYDALYSIALWEFPMCWVAGSDGKAPNRRTKELPQLEKRNIFLYVVSEQFGFNTVMYLRIKQHIGLRLQSWKENQTSDKQLIWHLTFGFLAVALTSLIFSFYYFFCLFPSFLISSFFPSVKICSSVTDLFYYHHRSRELFFLRAFSQLRLQFCNEAAGSSFFPLFS